MKAMILLKAGGGVLSLLPAIGIFSVSACSSRGGLETAGPAQLSAEVRSVLGNDWRSPEYHRARSRLQQMGPEVDSILVALVEDARARVEARADALVLLADRRSPEALPSLERALQYDHERLRAAAVQGLGRLTGSSNLAEELIRRATGDRARTVRMSALQHLDVADVETFRRVLVDERDPEVRQVALQLALLAESRGAPLARDERGALRTTAADGEPQIVFRPVQSDSATGVSRGDLRLEVDGRPDIPLSASATVVSRVVPAFFSPDRSAVVVENEGEIRVHDVSTGHVRSVGEGIAPRPIPFTYDYVFLRERSRSRAPGGLETAIAYDVFRTAFGGGLPERIGEMVAVIRNSRDGSESPVRAMVVDEMGEGFVLRGENLQTFRLPNTIWSSGRPNGGEPGGFRN